MRVPRGFAHLIPSSGDYTSSVPEATRIPIRLLIVIGIVASLWTFAFPKLLTVVAMECWLTRFSPADLAHLDTVEQFGLRYQVLVFNEAPPSLWTTSTGWSETRLQVGWPFWSYDTHATIVETGVPPTVLKIRPDAIQAWSLREHLDRFTLNPVGVIGNFAVAIVCSLAAWIAIRHAPKLRRFTTPRGQCWRCGYDIQNLPVCPECGEAFKPHTN
jgi:hypothetical protein